VNTPIGFKPAVYQLFSLAQRIDFYRKQSAPDGQMMRTNKQLKNDTEIGALYETNGF